MEHYNPLLTGMESPEKFITIGGITMMAAFVFMLLRKDDGDSLLPGRKKPVFETTSSPTPRNP